VVFLFFYQSIYTHDSKLKITDVYVREAVDCCGSVNEALYILVVLAITKYQITTSLDLLYQKYHPSCVPIVTFSIINVYYMFGTYVPEVKQN